MKTTSKPRGRPKLNHPTTDLGTPELQVKRNLLAKATPHHAESLLGVLWSQGLISQSMFAAGQHIQKVHYAFQYCLDEAAPRICSHEVGWGLPRKRHKPMTNLAEMDLYHTQAWYAVDDFLRQLGPDLYRAALRITLRALPHESLPPLGLKHAKEALNALENWLRTEKCGTLK